MAYVPGLIHRSANRSRWLSGPLPSAPKKRTTLMIRNSLPSADKQNALQNWLASEIANLAVSLPAPKASLLQLDAQITDLEIRCAKSHRGDHKSG